MPLTIFLGKLNEVDMDMVCSKKIHRQNVDTNKQKQEQQ